MSDDLEPIARTIAGRGRDALLERLRPAFSDAAKAHAGVLQLSDEQLEQMVQRAADRADGLQWRRALAAVATEELGISLGEALGHPAVVRAQEIVGAPSYEEALAAISASRPDESEPAAPAPHEPAVPESHEPAVPESHEPAVPESHEPAAPDPHEPAEPEPAVAAAPEAEPAEPTDPQPTLVAPPEPEPEPEPEPVPALAEPEPAPAPTLDPVRAEPEPPAAAAPEPELPPLDPEPVRVSAVHLGGVASLAAGASDIELFVSEHGLDIIRGADEILGRLTWDEIRALDVPSARSIRRRRREQGTNLIVRTRHGEAAFAIPAVSPEELRKHLDPLIRRYARIGAGR